MDEIIYNEMFLDSWREWCDYRIQEHKQKPYTPKGEKRWFNWFIKKRFTLNEAIECIDYAMVRKWEGLWDIRKNYNNGGQQTGKTGTSSARIDALKKW